MFVMFKHLIPNHTQSGFCISAEKFNPRPLEFRLCGSSPPPPRPSLWPVTFWAFLSSMPHTQPIQDTAQPSSTTVPWLCSRWGSDNTKKPTAEAESSPCAVPIGRPRPALSHRRMMLCQQRLQGLTAGTLTCWGGKCPCRTVGGLYCSGWPSNGYLASPESQQKHFYIFLYSVIIYFLEFSKLSQFSRYWHSFKRIKSSKYSLKSWGKLLKGLRTNKSGYEGGLVVRTGVTG